MSDMAEEEYEEQVDTVQVQTQPSPAPPDIDAGAISTSGSPRSNLSSHEAGVLNPINPSQQLTMASDENAPPDTNPLPSSMTEGEASFNELSSKQTSTTTDNEGESLTGSSQQFGGTVEDKYLDTETTELGTSCAIM